MGQAIADFGFTCSLQPFCSCSTGCYDTDALPHTAKPHPASPCATNLYNIGSHNLFYATIFVA